MRALLIVALLARVAVAEDEPVDDYDSLIYLRRSFEERGGRGCYDHLAVLRQRGVPETTTIYFVGWSENLPRGRHSLAHLNVVCARRMMRASSAGRS